MRRFAVPALAVLALGLPVGARAQTDVGTDHAGGLPWSVAAPQGADWTLVCRFEPVTMEMSRYDTRHWANRLDRAGHGPMTGRLPVDSGYCTLTKTGGPGPVAIGMARHGQTQARGTAQRNSPVSVGFQ
ncbi:MAG: hypothetical protein ACOH1H_03850 [Brevundimonas sp.]